MLRSASSVSRVLICGDLHHDPDHHRYLCLIALEHNCDVIVQLGDWGHFPHTDEGARFMKAVDAQLWAYNLEEFYLGGNHENYDHLYGTEWPIVEGFWQTGPQRFYIPRGHRWTWSGIRFLAMGGAASPNKDDLLRWEARSGLQRYWYWPQETITEADFYRATATPDAVDIMVTHDCPQSVRVPGLKPFSRDTMREAVNNRLALDEIVRIARPQWLYHGHLHWRYNTVLYLDGHRVQVHGLGANQMGADSWLVCDLEEMRERRG